MYEEWPSKLDGAVVWTRRPSAGAVYPVVPDGCMDLLRVGGRLLVAGPDTHGYVPDVRGIRYAGVRFAPGTAPAFLGVPAHGLRDRRVELADLWGGAKARRLAERVGEAPDPAAELEAVALGRAAAAVPPDPLLSEVVRRLDAGGTVAGAAAAVGLGARCSTVVRWTPSGTGRRRWPGCCGCSGRRRSYARVCPMPGAALRAGCADQAHLAREMRDLAGMTLGTYEAPAAAEIA